VGEVGLSGVAQEDIGLMNRNWSKQRFFNRPSSLYAGKERGVLKSIFFYPGANWLTLASKSKDMIVSSIALLFFLCGPSNISRLIISVVVDTINSQFVRTFSETSKKAFEGFKFWRNRYTSTSIMFIGFVIRIIASINHSCPDEISMRRFCSSGMAMLGMKGSIERNPETPAGFRVTDNKLMRIYFRCVPALAFTDPHGGSISSRSSFDYGKFAKCFSSQVFEIMGCHIESIA
jgi:hypothetical protein